MKKLRAAHVEAISTKVPQSVVDMLVGHAVVLIENYQKLNSRFMQLRCLLSMHSGDAKVCLPPMCKWLFGCRDPGLGMWVWLRVEVRKALRR